MSEEIAVSVICTSYNKGKWLLQALESVAYQETSFPYEVIVVDDASTDNSDEAIRAFQAEHPILMRYIRHERNLGISSTWREACNEARGTYIARIDGDDYWTDAAKLETQMRTLKESEGSLWCSTDFDMVDTDGVVICKNALATGAVTTVCSYEQMLAIKGLTNSSTWFVDADLMRAANESLLADDADDTFSIQLELFHRTKLTRVSASMCAMRVNAGSDSRPMTNEGAAKRFAGLKDQQLDFINKYDDADFRAMARYLVEQDAEKDLNVFQRDRRIGELENQVAAQAQTIAQLQVQLDEARANPARKAARAARAAASRIRKK